MSLVHRKTKAVIVRCGQPRIGPGHKNRCKEDVQLLNACLPSLSKGRVLDTRSQDVAAANMSKGRALSCERSITTQFYDFRRGS